MKVYKCDRCGNCYKEALPYSDSITFETGKVYLKMSDTHNGGEIVDLCDKCIERLNKWFNDTTLDELAHSEPQPSEPRPIKPPMYRATVDLKTQTLTVTRDDENGNMSYDEVKSWLKK